MRNLLLFVAISAMAASLSAQTRLYTNADLVRGSIQWTQTVTDEELRGLEARQFRLPRAFEGPTASAVPYDPTWPFTDSVRLEPRPIDPWTLPSAYGSFWPAPFVNYGYGNPYGGYRVGNHRSGGYVGASGRVAAARGPRAQTTGQGAPTAPPAVRAPATATPVAAPRTMAPSSGLPVRRGPG